jgi:hypothetical protein
MLGVSWIPAIPIQKGQAHMPSFTHFLVQYARGLVTCTHVCAQELTNAKVGTYVIALGPLLPVPMAAPPCLSL